MIDRAENATVMFTTGEMTYACQRYRNKVRLDAADILDPLASGVTGWTFSEVYQPRNGGEKPENLLSSILLDTREQAKNAIFLYGVVVSMCSFRALDRRVP